MGNPGVTRPNERSGDRGRDKPALAYRLTDTYGLVLLLIILDYIVVSTLFGTAWGKFISIFFLASTLLFTLRVSRSRRIWQLMAAIYLVVITVSALISIFIPGDEKFSQVLGTVAGSLLLVTPFVILRRVIAHPVVTTETVLGAVCVYLIIGFSFAFIYSMLALVSPPPFFTGVSTTTIDETLFFSYSTLTTVGYGNLVPSIQSGPNLCHAGSALRPDLPCPHRCPAGLTLGAAGATVARSWKVEGCPHPVRRPRAPGDLGRPSSYSQRLSGILSQFAPSLWAVPVCLPQADAARARPARDASYPQPPSIRSGKWRRDPPHFGRWW